jgi:hypothetical protein
MNGCRIRRGFCGENWKGPRRIPAETRLVEKWRALVRRRAKSEGMSGATWLYAAWKPDEDVGDVGEARIRLCSRI